MKAKSLSVFRTKLRSSDEGTVLVTAGQVIEGDDDHIRALARNRMVELIEDETTPKPMKPKTGSKPKAGAKPVKAKTDEPKPETSESPPEDEKGSE